MGDGIRKNEEERKGLAERERGERITVIIHQNAQHNYSHTFPPLSVNTWPHNSWIDVSLFPQPFHSKDPHTDTHTHTHKHTHTHTHTHNPSPSHTHTPSLSYTQS